MKKACAIAVLAIVGAGPAFGGEIFHWVDEEGVLHFSDWAPKESGVEVSKIVVSDSNPPGYDPQEDQNSILDQAERVNSRWAALKEKQEERRERQREQAERERQPQYAEYDYEYPWYGPGYYYRPGHRPGFVRPRPRPFGTQLRQAFALDRLGLLGGPRPHSINSSAHLARINAGKNLVTGFNPPPRVRPRGTSSAADW